MREQGPVSAEEIERQRAQEILERQKEEKQIGQILLTTENAPDIEIVERIEIITAECAYGMHIFKDLFAGVRDIVGGRSKAVQKTMREARRTALLELKREAHAVGANAVVGVDLDYVELSSPGNMVMLVASGTAVKAKL
ncbi:YbjQ family protein [uncultured Paracoccus sp.]|uniref:YbjQ family protein n=1 Tax=uncultured Paracoccus sp. TaxID=189685 RepID=UPI002620DD3D|nr:YbjQ family protein [uncultured Paracoccus sp.]